MMNNNRGLARAWRYRALARIFAYLALMAAACSQSSGDGDGSGSGGSSTSSGSSVGSSGSSGGFTSSVSTSSVSTSSVSTSSVSTSSGAGGTGAGGGSSGAVGSLGCGKTSTITFEPVPNEPPNGFGEGGYVRIQSGGQNRGFAMRLPDNYDKDKPYWLVFGFHWNGGNSKEVDSGGSNGYNMAHFGLQKMSNNGAIFVAPDGLNAGWGGNNLQFVDDMVKLIQENYCVDTTHIFANGFSYGGGMSYAIACARANVFRGVAIYNGAVLSGCEGGNDPIAYWQMAGLTDGVCTVDAARPMRDRFVANNGCTPQNPPQPPQPPPFLSPGGHICTDYAGCSDGHPLRWCVHQSGHGNAVVDGTDDLWNRCATPPQSCSDACPCTWVPEDVWSFFKSL
ncbi:prolyl oligopeptidase family serine peptidase [Sorangium sp. So ce260]|uniref:alpha/beta hydrolase family esterase n=1 Tax=Sorangium sp. So ce260 TaxID=3133291 RepID=UPI003F60AEE0